MESEEIQQEQEGVMDIDDSDSNGSNSAEALSEDDEVNEAEITQLREQIQLSPYVYDNHTKLITLLRRSAELDQLRDAREKMSECFPLTPELWLDWLTDEEKVAVTDEEKQGVIALFERAVKDYTSVSLWLEYVQYMIGQEKGEDGFKLVRDTFERALTAVGIHVTQGTLIWEAYREFEIAILSSLRISDSTLDAKQLEQIETQKNKIFSLFRRQLSVPLLYMDKTYKEFQETFPEKDDSALEQLYQKATAKLKQLMPFENALFDSESPHLEAYELYIEHEMESGDPIRIQSLYERCLVDNCLVPEMWLQYTAYIDQKVQIKNVVLLAHQKAVRNCPWSHTCWKNYILALERQSQPHKAITECFEKALTSGFTQSEEYQEIWMTFLDYMRRRVNWDQDHDTELQLLRATFERAVDHLTKFFKDSDAHCSILQYWAEVEANFCKNVSRGREIWNDIMNHGHHAEAEMWLNFATFEKSYGDEKHYRKLLLKALHSASDWPESVGDVLLAFERSHGTLESFDHASEKYDLQMKRAQRRRQRIAERETEKQKQEAEHKKHHRIEKKSSKRTNFQMQEADRSRQDNRKGIQMDSEGFKIPLPPQDLESSSEPSSKRMKTESEDRDTYKYDSTKNQRTVFLSNLAYTTAEEHIKDIFSKVGKIEEVRLVRDYKRRSKGYCYVVFSLKNEVEEALKMDRHRIDGRPVYVSRCEDRKSAVPTSSKFKFRVGMEKNKLFVKGLPPSTSEADLERIFKEYGPLKETRLVTYRNGHSKGLAYIEFENESSASTALLKTDGMKIEEHVISVAISDPPARKSKTDQMPYSSTTPVLGGGGSSSSEHLPRGRGRTQLSLFPRALQRPVQQQKKPSNSSANSIQNGSSSETKNLNENQKMSNADFRSMLLKK